MEQLAARRAHNPEVIGSSPIPATRNKKLPIIVGSFLKLFYLTQAPRRQVDPGPTNDPHLTS